MTASAQAESNAAEGREHFLAFVADSETAKIVERVASDMMIPSASVRQGSVRAAIEYLGSNRSPKLLVIDMGESELPLSDVNSLADVCEPGVSVIAIGERNDVGLFRDLLHHGVADYIVKPVTPELLQRSLLSATDQAGMSRQMNKLGKLVGVLGSRGGVGATSVATGLAWLIAEERKRRAALVDLDLQFGNVALALDMEPNHALREALENPNRIDSLFLDRALIQHSERLFVLCAEEGLDETLLLDYAALELLLTELRSKFHYVVIDLPRVPSPCLHHVLQTATNMIVVTDPSLAGMRDAMRVQSLLPSANASCAVTVVLNRSGEHRHGELSRDEIEKGVGRKVNLVLPFDAKTVAATTNVGRPIADARGPVAMGLRELADIVCGGAPGTRRRSWLQRLIKR
jgi:pilus assembly protein CpaE